MHITKTGFRRERDRARFQTGPGEIINKKTGEVTPMPSRTKQEFRDECDINNLLKQYRPHDIAMRLAMGVRGGQYMDLPEPQDFQESSNIVIQARDAFMTLPSKVRERFGNNPEQFLKFMADPDNVDEAVRLGLAIKKPEEAKADANGAGDKPPPSPPAPPAPPAPKTPG